MKVFALLSLLFGISSLAYGGHGLEFTGDAYISNAEPGKFVLEVAVHNTSNRPLRIPTETNRSTERTFFSKTESGRRTNVVFFIVGEHHRNGKRSILPESKLGIVELRPGDFTVIERLIEFDPQTELAVHYVVTPEQATRYNLVAIDEVVMVKVHR